MSGERVPSTPAVPALRAIHINGGSRWMWRLRSELAACTVTAIHAAT